MSRRQICGRLLLTLSLGLTLGMGIAIDWTVSHWVDPDWPAHARYHLLLYHGTLLCVGGAALWCLWGRLRAYPWSAGLAYFVILAIWLPFYPAALVASVSPIAVPEDVLFGLPANLVAGAIHFVVATIGVLLARASGASPDRRESAAP